MILDVRPLPVIQALAGDDVTRTVINQSLAVFHGFLGYCAFHRFSVIAVSLGWDADDLTERVQRFERRPRAELLTEYLERVNRFVWGQRRQARFDMDRFLDPRDVGAVDEVADDDVRAFHQSVDVAEELFSAALVPLSQPDDVGLVIPLGATDSDPRMPDNGLVVDVSILEVAPIPVVLLGDAVEAFDVEDKDAVADTFSYLYAEGIS